MLQVFAVHRPPVMSAYDGQAFKPRVDWRVVGNWLGR